MERPIIVTSTFAWPTSKVTNRVVGEIADSRINDGGKTHTSPLDLRACGELYGCIEGESVLYGALVPKKSSKIGISSALGWRTPLRNLLITSGFTSSNSARALGAPLPIPLRLASIHSRTDVMYLMLSVIA